MSSQAGPDEPRRSRWKRWHRIVLGIVAGFIVLGIIGTLVDTDDEEPASDEPAREMPAEPAPEADEEPEPEPEPEREPGHVRAEDYGDDWPLTAPEAFVGCSPPGAVTMLVPRHGTYAINGIAIGQGLVPELEPSDPVWRDNPDIGGVKVSIGPLIQAGLELCD